MATEYRVVFNYFGDWDYFAICKSRLIPDPVKVVKEHCTAEYVMLYNEFCEISNGGLIDKLNDIWKADHPNGDYDTDEYERFMAEGQEAACIEVNEKNPNTTMKIFMDMDHPDHPCTAIMKKGKIMVLQPEDETKMPRINFHIIPIEVEA